MPAPLKLEAPEALPDHLRSELARHAASFQRERFLEGAFRTNPVVKEIADRLDQFLATQRIRAYHCTREPEAGYFESNGLRLTDVASHQAWFMGRFGDQFTPEQKARLTSAWHDYFVRQRQAEHRNGLLWACLSRSLVLDEGCDPFFQYLGGEAISMVVDAHPDLAGVLGTLGRPVIVELAVDGANLHAGHPMSYAVLSLYHRSVRADAHLYFSEARWSRPVPPEDVLCVTPRGQFAP